MVSGKMDNYNLARFDLLGPSRFLTSLLKLFGLWPNTATAFTLQRLLYTIYTCVFQLVFTFMYTGFKCINFIYLTDLDEITRAMFICLTELALIVKIINFYARIRRMQNCLKTVGHFKLISSDEMKSMQEKLSLFMHIVIWYMAVANIAGIFSYMSPFFSTERILPYPGWYPLDWQHNATAYWLVYVYQVIGMFIQTHCLITIEMFPIFLMLMAGTYLDILGKRLRKIGYSQNGLLSREENSVQATAELIDCIKWHICLLE